MTHTTRQTPTRLIVTIDGPAGTGKSSVARDLAKKLGLEFLDTGAMYRAAAIVVIEQNIDTDDHNAVAEAVRDARIHFDWRQDPPALIASGAVRNHRLRDPDVSTLVSPISQIPQLRAVLVEKQRRIGVEHPKLVSEGRDQGSIVFPDADAKFFLDASTHIRAQRRVQQLKQAGKNPDPAAIQLEIKQRDHTDSARAVGPLTCPNDATRIHTDNLQQHEVVTILEQTVRDIIAQRHTTETAPLG